MLFLDDLELFLQVTEAVLGLLELGALFGQLGLQLLDLILFLLDHGTCCLVLRCELSGLSLLLFLLLDGDELALLFQRFLLPRHLFRLELRRDLLLLCIVDHLLQPLFLRLCLCKEYVTFGDRAAELLQLRLQDPDLHLVVLNVLLGDLQQLAQLRYRVLTINFGIVLD